MTSVKELKATARARVGKGAARSVRRSGRVPGVIYGDSKDPITISVDHAELKQRIYAGRFLTTIYELDPVKDLPIHVDFLRLGVGAKIRVRIPVRVMNADQAPGVKRGGTVNIVTHAVEVQCAPEDIPDSIEVDISSLEINYSKHLSDIVLPTALRVVERTDPTLVTIVPPSGYAEEMKAAAEAAAAAAAAAPGAPAAAPAAAAPAAPKK